MESAFQRVSIPSGAGIVFGSLAGDVEDEEPWEVLTQPFLMVAPAGRLRDAKPIFT